MEADGQKYSVLAKTQVREKMMKEIEQISEVFLVSKSDATVILIRLGWNSFKASDLLGDNKEKFLAKLGLARVLNSNSSSADRETGDGDYLVSTPFCSHKFSTTCWSEYLSDALKKNKEQRGLISCLSQDCVASVGPDTIEQLTEPVKEMYENYILESFMECHKATIKWCPASGCEYAVELQEDGNEDNVISVVCLCGHTFCWTCGLESHRPVSCKKASIWWTYLLDQSRSISWIHTNTKSCPKCKIPVQQNGDPNYRLINCICSNNFCWICLRTEEQHQGNWNCSPVAVPAAGPSTVEFSQILHLNLWEAGHEALKKAKSKLRALEEKIIPKLIENCGATELDIRTVREAGMLSVQCRQVLKWSCVFDYSIIEYESTKKQYLKHLRALASTMLCMHEGKLDELIHLALSPEDFTNYNHKLEISTTCTGNHFDGFIKELEDGKPEVKADGYENEPGSRWFCDRCTFENSWVDKQCKMCFFPLDYHPSPQVAAAPEDLGKSE
ncbi:unnamed protein product [Arabidopsis thaliana]|uniref:RBR-type E3 ubiquitin transferase n=1 Tax=Arabidopsis thaliana TaxID=3702 RepID=A0A7G2FDD1_ARATH|nr:unnamed protein product [Arabidopsis thaliana]